MKPSRNPSLDTSHDNNDIDDQSCSTGEVVFNAKTTEENVSEREQIVASSEEFEEDVTETTDDISIATETIETRLDAIDTSPDVLDAFTAEHWEEGEEWRDTMSLFNMRGLVSESDISRTRTRRGFRWRGRR